MHGLKNCRSVNSSDANAHPISGGDKRCATVYSGARTVAGLHFNLSARHSSSTFQGSATTIQEAAGFEAQTVGA
eukprot:4866882-Pleurochrysis_carterae.AAC.8